MANRHYTEFPERKLPEGGGEKPVQAREGKTQKGGPVKATETAWPKPGPTWGTSFNRTTKWPVVRTRVVKHGVD